MKEIFIIIITIILMGGFMVYNNYVDNYEVMNNVDKKYDDTYIEIIQLMVEYRL